MVLWRKGGLIQLPGWVHIESTPLDALMGVEYHIGGVVAARGENLPVATSPTQL